MIHFNHTELRRNISTEIFAEGNVRHIESQFIHYESSSYYKLSRDGFFLTAAIYKTLATAESVME
jgi:hypothetical protein